MDGLPEWPVATLWDYSEDAWVALRMDEALQLSVICRLYILTQRFYHQKSYLTKRFKIALRGPFEYCTLRRRSKILKHRNHDNAF